MKTECPNPNCYRGIVADRRFFVCPDCDGLGVVGVCPPQTRYVGDLCLPAIPQPTDEEIEAAAGLDQDFDAGDLPW